MPKSSCMRSLFLPHLGVLRGDLLEVVHSGADVVGAHEQGVELLEVKEVVSATRRGTAVVGM